MPMKFGSCSVGMLAAGCRPSSASVGFSPRVCAVSAVRWTANSAKGTTYQIQKNR
ncbi:hypothetical protein [Blastococcus sp. PRF04-17]|uniref:hypothetical protein n=1 Tax=Blastococcus sp. PRF04-17 TaxID=2933797 RepID=UPI0035304C93